ncbi:ABC transporter substrate-binding protein [Beijerinckia indica]|uniref:Putative aliphatic sulfonates-binding protein n=1 Tax=Beijerinckia indica subsp. indica (strain ATCC 9039 / DSM 1715 / NCIMB 8712) TaxID=395963 RepID=B2IBM2_BEII9|nr:ABC transporter substrate-binding protein [Beijerinckia indica]ACB96648.1 aliphatic sulfonates family ABC transporter, periplsmic ligand-binding protein [Beijerinckia indica subsp. indica ATCC 9039]
MTRRITVFCARRTPVMRLGLLLALVLYVITSLSTVWADDTDVLKIGDQKGGTHALMQAAGVLDDIPYRLEWRVFAAAAPLTEALAAGAIDAGLLGDAPFLFAYASGAPIRVIAAAAPDGEKSAGVAILVPKNSQIKSPQELKGHLLGTIRGSAGHHFALLALEHFGIDPRDVKFVFLGPAEAKAALSTGAIDAWSIWDPYLTLAEMQDGARPLVDGPEVPRTGFVIEAANIDAINKKQALLENFLGRFRQARTWLGTHIADYAQVWAKETGLPVEVANVVAQRHYALFKRDITLDHTLSDQLAAVFDIYRRLGVVTLEHGVPDIDKALAPVFNSVLSASSNRTGQSFSSQKITE